MLVWGPERGLWLTQRRLSPFGCLQWWLDPRGPGGATGIATVGLGVRLSEANFLVLLYDFATGLPVHLPASTCRLCDLGPVASSLRAFVSSWVEWGQ